MGRNKKRQQRGSTPLGNLDQMVVVEGQDGLRVVVHWTPERMAEAEEMRRVEYNAQKQNARPHTCAQDEAGLYCAHPVIPVIRDGILSIETVIPSYSTGKRVAGMLPVEEAR